MIGPTDSGVEDLGPPDLAFDMGIAPDLGDADMGTDAGPPPAHCSNGLLDPVDGETDVDCGGPCSGCAACRACTSSADCEAPATCDGSVCRPEATTVSGLTAYRDSEGRALLAHYGPGVVITDYDPRVAQTPSGPAEAGFFPDPCDVSGHLDLDAIDLAGRRLRFECGNAFTEPRIASSVTDLFASFDLGVKGTAGTAGTVDDPGWGIAAATNTGTGRIAYSLCGRIGDASTGGIAICDGEGMPTYTHHLVSYTIDPTDASPFVGCLRDGCNGPTCPLHVWVWLEP